MHGRIPHDVLHCLFGLSFLGDNIFWHMVVKARQPFGKDVVYDSLRTERFNWRRLFTVGWSDGGSFFLDLAILFFQKEKYCFLGIIKERSLSRKPYLGDIVYDI